MDGVAARDLARRWGVPQVALFRRLASALDAIHELAAQDAPTGTVVLPDEQTAGRGRDGRSWRSPPGGVWLALLLRPAGGDPQTVAIRGGLALADAVDALIAPGRTRLKWPNDLLLNGRKLAGILCEGRWQGESLQWLALGIGVNVGNAIPDDLAEYAVAVHQVASGVRKIDLLDRLVPSLLGSAAHGGLLTERELTAFATRDWLRGRQLRRPVFGRAAGLRPDGALLVEREGGTTAVRDGRVELA